MTDNTDLTTIKPTAPAEAGGKVQAIVPQNSTEAFALSKAIFGSGLAPNGLKSAEQVMVVVMKGSEVGFAPMQALSTIALINGRLSIYGDGLPAVVYRAGGVMDEKIEGNGDARTATCVVTRANGHTTTRSFSVADARKARLWGKAGPWSQYPDRMLQMRARGFAVRDGMADALNGLYVAEDIQDAPAPQFTPQAVPESANRLQARLGTTEGVTEPTVEDVEQGEISSVHPDEWLNYLGQTDDPSQIVGEWTLMENRPDFRALSDAKQKALSAATNARVDEIEQEVAA